MPKSLYAALPLVFLLGACTPQGKDITPADTAETIKQGYALINTGKPEEAINLFDKLIVAAPDNAAAYNGKGVAFDHAGNHLAAQDLYQHALTLSPDSVSIRNNLAMSLILNRQFDEAISILEELNQPKTSNKTIRQNLALAYGLKGDVTPALALNLQDLPPTEAQENMRFYKAYAHSLKKLKTSDLPSSNHVGFSDTPTSAITAADKKAAKIKHKEVVAAPIAEPAQPPANTSPVEEKEIEPVKKAGEPAEVTPLTDKENDSLQTADMVPAPQAPAPTDGSTTTTFPSQRSPITY